MPQFFTDFHDMFGVPFLPFLICGVISAGILISIMGKDNPIVAVFSLLIGWICSGIFDFIIHLNLLWLLIPLGLVVFYLGVIAHDQIENFFIRRNENTSDNYAHQTNSNPAPYVDRSYHTQMPKLPYVKAFQGKPISSQKVAQVNSKRYTPEFLWHGCKDLSVAQDIYQNKWIVGNSAPPGVWFSEVFNYCKQHVNHNGIIIKVQVDPDVRMKLHDAHQDHRIWTAPIPNAIRHDQKYRLKGVTPIEIYNSQKQRVSIGTGNPI